MSTSARDRLASALGPRLRPDRPVGRAMRWVHHHLPTPPPTRPIAQVITEFAKLHPRASFVQVGAHDGTQLDPLRDAVLRRRWTGVMVEPVPYVFDRLAANYARNRRVAVANTAIADIDGTRDFHHLDKAADGDEVWQWYDALGSFRRDVVLSHAELIPDIEDRIVTTPVPCMTFETLCRQHALTRVDLVQIDTEGYDYEIIKQIDLERFQVKLLMYENLHLDPDARTACEARLRGEGYDLISDGMDTLALHRRERFDQPRLGELWTALAAQNGPR